MSNQPSTKPFTVVKEFFTGKPKQIAPVNVQAVGKHFDIPYFLWHDSNQRRGDYCHIPRVELDNMRQDSVYIIRFIAANSDLSVLSHSLRPFPDI